MKKLKAEKGNKDAEKALKIFLRNYVYPLEASGKDIHYYLYCAFIFSGRRLVVFLGLKKFLEVVQQILDGLTSDGYLPKTKIVNSIKPKK